MDGRMNGLACIIRQPCAEASKCKDIFFFRLINEKQLPLPPKCCLSSQGSANGTFVSLGDSAKDNILAGYLSSYSVQRCRSKVSL